MDPVVQGKTRAEQFYKGDTEGKKVFVTSCINPFQLLDNKIASIARYQCLCKSIHRSVLTSTHGSCRCRNMGLIPIWSSEFLLSSLTLHDLHLLLLLLLLLFYYYCYILKIQYLKIQSIKYQKAFSNCR